MIDWSLIWMVTIVGFLFVVVLLVALVGIMKLFGYAFTCNLKKKPAVEAKKPSTLIVEEEVAAIATALQLYKSNLHDKEMDVITIHKIKSTYSPWNSKIYGLTQTPEHRR